MSIRRLAVFFLVLGSLSLLLLFYLSPRVTAYWDDDSAPYIEAARNLRAGNGLTTWPYTYEDDGAALDALRPLDCFPPVFPVLIYIATLTGVSAEDAATWIPRVSFLFLPLCFYLVLRRVIGDGAAIAAAVFSGLQAATVFYSLLAMSDVPFLLFALLAFLALFRALDGGSAPYAAAAGIASGLALGMRNAGAALPAGIVLGWMLGRAAGLAGPRSGVRVLLPYAAGLALSYAPVVLRNVAVFGTPQPYAMPPSEKGLGEIGVELLRGIDGSLFGGVLRLRTVAALIVLVLAVSVVLLLRKGASERLRDEHPHRAGAGLVLLSYGFVGIALLVAMEATYRIDPIDGRFLLPYLWVFVGWIALLGSLAVRRARAASRAAGSIALGICLALPFLPQYFALREYAGLMAWTRDMIRRHEAILPLVENFPEETCLVAVEGPKLRLLFRRPVLQLGEVSPEELREMARRAEPDRELVLILRDDPDPAYRDWRGVFEGAVPDGYRELGRHEDIAVLALDRAH